jgi:hypothetical protein
MRKAVGWRKRFDDPIVQPDGLTTLREAGCKLPTRVPELRSRCFCGAEVLMWSIYLKPQASRCVEETAEVRSQEVTRKPGACRRPALLEL